MQNNTFSHIKSNQVPVALVTMFLALIEHLLPSDKEISRKCETRLVYYLLDNVARYI